MTDAPKTKTVKTVGTPDPISLTNFCQDEKDHTIIAAMQADPQKSHRELADMLGIPRRTVSYRISRVKAEAVKRGYSPDHDMTHHHPDGIKHKGTSSLYDKNGNLVLQWVKTTADQQRQAEMIEEFAKGFLTESEPLPYKPYKRPKGMGKPDSDLIPFFCIGDMHIGLKATMEQVGANFNLEIAEREIKMAMRMQIDRAPFTERCVLSDMGDGVHRENIAGMTDHSGHLLDCDGTYGDMVRVYASVMRDMIDYAAGKFKYVDVIVNQGNHSRTSDLWASVFLTHVYEKNSRIHILENRNVFIPYRAGNTFILFHHGDKVRGDRFAQVMSQDYPVEWGECRYRLAWHGHCHHKQITKENNGVIVESFNHMAGKDAYAHEYGWRSRAMLTCVHISKKYGEVGRQVLTGEEVKDMVTPLESGSHADTHPRNEVYSV